jgi:hypothetical protein
MAEAPARAPSADEVDGWVGWEIDPIDSADGGPVQGYFADADSGEPTWLVVKLGRFGGRLVAVPVRSCAGGGGRVWVAHERAAIRGAPVVDPTCPLLREHELTICEHFGIGEDLGRAAEVAGRPQGAVTSQPPARS